MPGTTNSFLQSERRTKMNIRYQAGAACARIGIFGLRVPGLSSLRTGSLGDARWYSVLEGARCSLSRDCSERETRFRFPILTTVAAILACCIVAPESMCIALDFYGQFRVFGSLSKCAFALYGMYIFRSISHGSGLVSAHSSRIRVGSISRVQRLGHA
jgi:hypothetical protein